MSSEIKTLEVGSGSMFMDYLVGEITWTHCPLGPLLLTWFNFNPSMDK